MGKSYHEADVESVDHWEGDGQRLANVLAVLRDSGGVRVGVRAVPQLAAVNEPTAVPLCAAYTVNKSLVGSGRGGTQGDCAPLARRTSA